MDPIFDSLIQEGGKALLGVFSREAPKFPRVTQWAGETAMSLWRRSTWLALPLGPFRIVLGYLMMRKTRLDIAMMPMTTRLTLGIGAGIAAGLTILMGRRRR